MNQIDPGEISDWNDWENLSRETGVFLVWPQQAFKVNAKMKHAKPKLSFFSKNRNYILKFNIKMEISQDEQFNKK